ncbi:MAG: histidinol dehydrogenase [Rhizobiales bacterium NRL2]|jgi:histidinol dehydrogenase|nr:MAG: histidinol dehydrogenase [Rhizobiales bacterium NRL2]
MPRRLDGSAASFEADFRALLDDKRETAADVDETVQAIIADVRTRGDLALIDYTARFDRVQFTPSRFRIGADEIEAAKADCEPDTLAAMKLAATRIAAFHERQLPADDRVVDAAGVELGARWTAIGAVGLYVPGGLAAYPSSVLMNAVPAKVAGVERIAMTVPTPDGVINPLVIAAAEHAGVTEIYRLGGAQAIAALAYGTEAVPAVDKIVGPGNAYVAAAKRQVFGAVGIDMIAGPSEILVVADGENDPAWIAADLLSQSEHDESAQAILITDDRAFADDVAAAVEHHLATLPRAAIARSSWEAHGAIIVLDTLDDAPALVDRIAPEHLELAVNDPDAMMARVRNAGAIFLGRHTPEAIGDYVAGPNHVLPTARSARFSSGLNVLDFMKRTTFVRCDAASLGEIGPAAATLADAEGLPAHALSVRIRMNR